MRKIGIRYYDTDLSEQSFIAMSEGGMTAVELCCVKEPGNLDFKKVREYADRYGIYIWTTHLPFQREWAITQETEEARKWAFDFQCMMIERATDIGVDKFVIHPGKTILGMSREESKNYVKDALSRLADFAHARGAQIAVENMIPSCLGNTADELLELISENDKLRICFDTNHLLLGSHKEFLEKVRDKLITMHINDYDFENERHWLAGYGKIDWVALYKKLCEVGYEGAWIYELSPGEKTYTNRPLTVRDFYNNATEIFAGKVPSKV